MAEIDVAVFAFNEVEELKLVNRAGERLLGEPGERLLGRKAAELDLAECLTGPGERSGRSHGRSPDCSGSFREKAGRTHHHSPS
jgi:nitrogen fixation/metabolism regulation signal transduction histidine kinase